MQALRQFSIPLKGLKNGIHEFVFHINKNFFSSFDSSPVNNGQLETKLNLEKKSDHIILDFFTKGYVNTDCDRCTALIKLPVESDFEAIVKFREEPGDDGDVIYIQVEEHQINVATLIYEQIILSIPLIKTYNCESEDPKPCNEKVLSILTKDSKKSTNPIGEALKNLKID
ncbi:MAG: DUF177 domain-containing protein [Bacteroidia bacterium]|nr:DUF177 domain-containing protein [Bacteroidia bacterium]